ncbi:unnamed protein product, partial [Rotaria magnacalcarata]
MPQLYDHVFAHIARLGYPVRLTKPNLVVSEIRHVSLIRPRPKHTNFHCLTLRANFIVGKLRITCFHIRIKYSKSDCSSE